MKVCIFGSTEIIKNTNRHNRLTYSPLSPSLVSADLVSGFNQNKEALLVPAARMMREESCGGRYILHTLTGFSRQAWLKLLFPFLVAKMLRASLPTLWWLEGKTARDTNSWGEMLNLPQCRSQEYDENCTRTAFDIYVSQSKVMSQNRNRPTLHTALPHTWPYNCVSIIYMNMLWLADW